MIKQKVWTPNGYQVGPTNSMVGKGESIIDYTNGTGTLVTKGKVGVDNQPSSVRQDDRNVIAGNDIDWTNGMKFSQQIAPLTARLQMYNDIEKKANKKQNMSSLSKQTMQLQSAQLERAKAPILQAMKNITDRQERQHQIEDYAAQFKANCGKDKFANGKNMWEGVKDSFNNWIKSGKGKVSNATLDAGYMIPAVLEKQMLNHWMKENPLMPNIYAANRYGQSALQTLNRLRINPYNQLQSLNQNDRAAYYRMQQDGGYTGGQRQAGRVALALGNARNVADVLNNADLQNNKYRQNWATAALEEGGQDAARRQAANQYAWDAYNRANGAKTKGIETHLSNLGLIGQKWLAQRIKNKQYGDVLDMYQQDLDNKKDALKAIYGIGGNTSTIASNHTASFNNTQPNQQPYETNLYQRSIQSDKNWQQKAIQDIENLPLPDSPYQYTNYLDTIDWAKYFDGQKKYNKIITGKNGIPKSSQYTYFTKANSPLTDYLSNLIPQLIPTLPDTSKYMQEYQKRMGMPMDKLRSNYNKYLGGDILIDSGEPLGFTRTSTPFNKNTIKKYGFPINQDQMIRGLMLYNNNFKIPYIKR